jgi:hypothetical protein
MPKEQTELLPAVKEDMPVGRPFMGVPEMLQAVIEKGVTQENVAAVGEIVKLYERMQEKDAEKEFNRAFVALQSELPAIVATTVIPNRGKYEKFEDVMKVVGPLLGKHGFTVSFSMDFKENRIIETCCLKHIGGHSQSNSFAVRSGKADSDTQADCKAATTAKRNALLNALNIVIRQDVLNSEDDAGIEDDPNDKVTPEQAEELERRAQLTNSNIAAFLKYAQADKFANIPARNYGMLDEMLTRKERSGR